MDSHYSDCMGLSFPVLMTHLSLHTTSGELRDVIAALRISLDVQIAHAICPQCKICW